MANCCENTLDAAKKGHTNCIKDLRDVGHPWHPNTTFNIAWHGHGYEDMLPRLHELGCPWDPQTTYVAAMKGRNDMLRLLHELGCPWHPETTFYAAKNGYVDTLHLLLELGCPWHPYTTWIAAIYGHINVLKYIYENCGDDISWEASGFEEYEYKDEIISDNVKEYIGGIEESWKSGMNRTGYALKPARDK